MRLLWVKSDFLHPTTRGGQIRTLEMLRRIHARHEVHYVAFDNPAFPEGLQRAGEYSSFAYPVPHHVPDRNTAAFAGQLIAGLFSPLPVSVSRYQSAAMKQQIESVLAAKPFDSIVCDFLFPAPNIPKLEDCVLFQHNVESIIWRRHVEHAKDALRKSYLALQAHRMHKYEKSVCQRSGHVIAVSTIDAEIMRREFRIDRVSAIETGVDIEYFTRPTSPAPVADLVFVGSMDWLPNIDAMQWFVSTILPLIRQQAPKCSVAIVGRKPDASIKALEASDPLIRVTGTVPDVRPYLWGSKVSITPLRIGGGTRLKIYEAMAAGLPVVSTTVGAEGLPVENNTHIAIADTPEQFAATCIELLEDEDMRQGLAGRAFDLISARFGWDTVARSFESILEAGPKPHAQS